MDDVTKGHINKRKMKIECLQYNASELQKARFRILHHDSARYKKLTNEIELSRDKVEQLYKEIQLLTLFTN